MPFCLQFDLYALPASSIRCPGDEATLFLRLLFTQSIQSFTSSLTCQKRAKVLFLRIPSLNHVRQRETNTEPTTRCDLIQINHASQSCGYLSSKMATYDQFYKKTTYIQFMTDPRSSVYNA